ncbi:MAG: insulinase family protein [Acidobacteria bacterium]|nr:insulinase family protein [Acidobacteriota bacterium]
MRSQTSSSGALAARRAAAGLLVTASLAVMAAPATAQSLADFEKKTTVHRLENGWTFLIVERPVAPVFSFATRADVGGAQEVAGITGLAHMFEHMAFKGTDKVGTKDYAAEKASLEAIDRAYEAFDRERRKKGADPARVKDLEDAWKDAQEEAARHVVRNEFGDIVDRQGGVGLNAFTTSDATVYFYSLPSNKLELWAYLESERFLHPVLREFYKERDVVKEERRMRTESQPVGRLIEQFLAAAFVAHPYGQPVVGHMSDLDSFSARDAQAFYRTHYVPSSMVTAVVGDVKASEVIPMVERYFGRIPGGDPPPPLRTMEPAQNGERVVKLADPSQPVYAEGYHKPAATGPDNEAYDALATILGGGRTSRLYRGLVRDARIAAAVQAFSGFPGDKYPNLFMVLGIAAKGHTNDAVKEAMRAEIERIRSEEVGDAELAAVKARAKADLIRSLASNQRLALNLADYQTLHGDWRELFLSVNRIDRVTKADILKVAKATLADTNRTVGIIETTGSATPKPSASTSAKPALAAAGG